MSVKGFWALMDNIYDCVFTTLDFPVITFFTCKA
jgi:hypothetical protein